MPAVRQLTVLAQPSLCEAVGFWWKLGWISFGGTAAHLAIMHAELVEKRKWIDSEDFFHGLSHCLLLPGPEGQQLAIYLGWKLHGTLGGVLAGTLFVLPSTAILLVLSLIYARLGQLGAISMLFHVLKPVVVALVLKALFSLGRRALRTRLHWLIAAVSFLGLTCLHITLPWLMGTLLLVSIVRGMVEERSWAGLRRMPAKAARLWFLSAMLRTMRIAGGCAACAMVPLLFLKARGGDFLFWMRLSGFFTRTAFVTLGGSYTVIPYVAQLAVGKFAWLSHAQMLDGFALAETTPGPLIIVVGFVGFMAGFHHFHHSLLMGTIALLVTVFYTFLPCFLFVLAGARWMARSGEHRLVRSALSLIPAAVVAAILQLTLFLLRALILPAGAGAVDVRPLASTAGTLLLIELFAWLRRRLATVSRTAGQ